MATEKFIRDTKSTIYPQLYHDFTAQCQGSEESASFHVEDLSDGKVNAAIEFLVKNHELTAEFKENFNIQNADGTDKAPRVFYREILERKLSLICSKPGSRDVMAVNMLIVKTKGHSDEISKVGV